MSEVFDEIRLLKAAALRQIDNAEVAPELDEIYSYYADEDGPLVRLHLREQNIGVALDVEQTLEDIKRAYKERLDELKGD